MPFWGSHNIHTNWRANKIFTFSQRTPKVEQVVGLGESEFERLVCGWRREAGSWVDSRDEGKHTGRSDLLFVENMV